MPIIKESSYRVPTWMKNAHFETVYPTLFRTIAEIKYDRERISTPDGDFLDLDWSRVSSKTLAVVCHGLESDSKANYVLGIVSALNKENLDALAINFRSCSGEMNNKAAFYHSGKSEDLHTILEHVLEQSAYEEILLVGFSMGGNVALKYLGEKTTSLSPLIKKAVVFSVPVDLKSSSDELAKRSNRIYMNRFLKSLRQKIQEKKKLFPGEITDEGFSKIKSFKDYDDAYTAPLNGYKDAEDYWAHNSSKQFLKDIKVPTLIVNAKNDPFLGEGCFPYEEAKNNPNLFLETPEHGGHVGFCGDTVDDTYWSEQRILAFLLGA